MKLYCKVLPLILCWLNKWTLC